jgi:hypothetical protein
MRENGHEVPGPARGTALKTALGVVMLAALAAACGTQATMWHGAVDRPRAEEFDMEGRRSEAGVYQAVLEPAEPVRIGRMQTMRLRVGDAGGAPIGSAAITVDGGMPEHGHGLPTRPRVTARDDGSYDVEGLRFNMTGWWVLRFRITGDAGTDTVIFNLDL